LSAVNTAALLSRIREVKDHRLRARLLYREKIRSLRPVTHREALCCGNQGQEAELVKMRGKRMVILLGGCFLALAVVMIVVIDVLQVVEGRSPAPGGAPGSFAVRGGAPEE